MIARTVLDNRSRPNNSPYEPADAGTVNTSRTGASVPVAAASASIAVICASASARRPLLSSQRGLSGMFLRMNHTSSAHTPMIANSARQPSVGISQAPPSPTKGTAQFVMTDSIAT